MVIGEAHHLAAPPGGGGIGGQGRALGRHLSQRGEAVVEDDNVVPACRDLSRSALGRRAEWALGSGGQVGANLPMRGHYHPIVVDRVIAQLGPGIDRLELPRIDLVVHPAWAVVEVDDPPAVGKAAFHAMNVVGARCEGTWARHCQTQDSSKRSDSTNTPSSATTHGNFVGMSRTSRHGSDLNDLK